MEITRNIKKYAACTYFLVQTICVLGQGNSSQVPLIHPDDVVGKMCKPVDIKLDIETDYVPIFREAGENIQLSITTTGKSKGDLLELAKSSVSTSIKDFTFYTGKEKKMELLQRLL
jgi:hypothetical protein